MGEKDSLFRLRWDNQGSLLGSVASLFHEEAFVDTSIFTEGKLFKAHRLLLSASSPYLKHVLQSVPGEYHSVLLLPHVNANDFEHVLKFIYEGEIKINQKDLKSFLHVARILKIKGMDFDDEEAEDLLGHEPNYAQEHSTNNNHHKSSTTATDHSRPSTTTVAGANDQENDDSKEHSSSKQLMRESLQLQHQDHPDERGDEYDDDKEITFLSGDDDDSGDPLAHRHHHNNNNDILDENPDDGESDDNEGLGLPLLPEVSMEVDASFDLKHPIMQAQVSSRSWGIPHSSTSSSHRNSSYVGGGAGSSKPGLLKRFGSTGEGILMRMMKEPLKSSMMSPQAQILYDLDETGQRRTKRYVQCSSCSKVLSSLSALKRHMEDVHCARIQGKCLICGRVYSSRNSLLTHVYSAHKKHHDYKAVARIIRESDFESFATTTTT